MTPQFIRLFSKNDEKEILINVAHISKIEVEYALVQDRTAWKTTIGHAREEPAAIRIYRVFAAGEEFVLPANPNSPVMAVINEIYENAIKT